MTTVSAVLRYPQFFKITSYGDCLEFLDSVMGKGYVKIEIDRQHLLIIEKDANGEYRALEKFGNLSDPFNPEVQCPDEIKTMYKYRKYINRACGFVQEVQ